MQKEQELEYQIYEGVRGIVTIECRVLYIEDNEKMIMKDNAKNTIP